MKGTNPPRVRTPYRGGYIDIRAVGYKERNPIAKIIRSIRNKIVPSIKIYTRKEKHKKNCHRNGSD